MLYLCVCVQRGKGKGKGKEKQGQTSGTREPPSLYTRLLSPNLHPNLRFDPQSNERYNEYNEALTKLLKQDCEYPRRIDWEPLKKAEYFDTIEAKLTQSIRWGEEVHDVEDWIKLMDIQEPIYLELCQEFFATVLMYDFETLDDPYFLSFRLGGKFHSLSLRELAACLQIYSREEMEAEWFEKYLMEGARVDEGTVDKDDWERFSDNRYLAGSNASSGIRSTKYRILQKLISHTIANRGKNTEKVSKVDLWYLVRLKNRDRVNIPCCVGKYLYVYAGGLKPESKMCGGQYITRIARAKHVNFVPREHPFTLCKNTTKPIGVEMYRAAGALKVQKGKIIAVSKDEAGSSKRQARAGARGRPTRVEVNNEEGDDEDEEEEDEDQEMHEAEVQPSQPVGVQNWEGFLSDFNNMRMEQRDFRDEARYEWGVDRYKSDWLVHNVERIYQGGPDRYPTPYSHPPLWGAPGGVLPAPVYDRDAALVEMQRQHQIRMHQGEPGGSSQRQGQHDQSQGLESWLFHGHPPDPSQHH